MARSVDRRRSDRRTPIEPARLSITYSGKTAEVGLRRDVVAYFMDQKSPAPTDWRTTDVLNAVWAAFQRVKG